MSSETQKIEEPDSDVGDIHALHDPIQREKARPRDGFQPVPMFLIFTFFTLLMWGGWYIGEYDGGWRPDVLTPEGELTLATGVVEKEDVDPMVLGKRQYTQCQACHQSNGQGVTGAFPPLDGSERVLGHPAAFTRILLHGLAGEVIVKGESYNGNMPAWGEQMSDEQIAAVMTYVRKSWSNDAGAVSTELVTQVREETSARNTPWTDAELDALDLAPQ